MALVYETGGILDQLDKIRENYGYTVAAKDVVIEQLYSQSPINYDMIYSLSLDAEDFGWARKQEPKTPQKRKGSNPP